MSRHITLFNAVSKQLEMLKLGIIKNSISGHLKTRNLCFSPGILCNFTRQFHQSLPRMGLRVEDRRKMLSSVPEKDEGTEGELGVGIDSIKSREDMFPHEGTPNMLFNGVPFKEVPICHIRVTPNNTILSLADGKTGDVKIIRSCGVEGFKNTRKGTNVAAQATAISFSLKVLERGYKSVRVSVRGLGPGRMSAIKGLQMGGLNIISVSDTTRASFNPPRPPRPKSL